MPTMPTTPIVGWRAERPQTSLAGMAVADDSAGTGTATIGAPVTEDEDAPRDALAVLAAAGRALHGEPDLAKLVAWTVDAIADLVGAKETAVCLLAHDTTPAWTSHPSSSVAYSLLGDPRTVPLIAPALDMPGGVVYPDLRRAEASLPARDRVRRIVPVDGLVVVPILGSDGLPLGLLLAGWRDGPAATPPSTREALVALAAHVGVAVENQATITRMAEEEARGKEVVHLLQQAVRPPAPIVPFTELGVHYVAADPSAPTGGDLYDWLVLPDGALHVTIVDVMGKGVQATKDALIVTHALRLLAIDGCELDNIVSRADALVSAQNPELVATLQVIRFWPETGRLQIAGAGHPPALLVHGRDVTEVPAPGIPIGWPGAGSHGVVEASLDRSDTLILYTDGLIEATKDILRGLDDLAVAARETASYPANSLARALVDRQLADAARHDDSLALVVRRRAPAPTTPTHVLAPFQHQFSTNPAAVPVARHLFRDWLERVPVEADSLDGLLLIASELATNAVLYAGDGPGSVTLHAAVVDDGIVIRVSDDGGAGAELPTSVVEQPELPDPEAERGRGLFLVRELSDEVTWSVEDGRTTVTVLKNAVIAAAEPATFA
jgi:serine phosphatase RsbU (regulator of sigma subunit)/anti-sigma regulatory factor (Ser/Thr protein kinase)